MKYDFNSKFKMLAEENTSRYTTGGGLLMGDYITIRPDVFNNPKIKGRPSQFFEKIKELIGSKLPLKVSAIKSERAESQNGLYGGADAPTHYWIDVVQCVNPGFFANPITLPIEVVEMQKPEDGNFSPDLPTDWKYDNKEKIKPEEVKLNDDELNKQTQGNNRKNPTKDTKGLGKEPVDGRKNIKKPKEYKESVDATKDDVELLAETYSQIITQYSK